jgi:membrane protein DedA with SNARE-associated domain
MEILAWFWDLVVHLDQHLEAFVAQHGAWVYALLFLIVFCETGLVVTPFLPGDSLLFVAGALIWVVSLCLAGYLFGNIPEVKSNLTIVILGIVALSLSPGVIAWLRSRLARRQG